MLRVNLNAEFTVLNVPQQGEVECMHRVFLSAYLLAVHDSYRSIDWHAILDCSSFNTQYDMGYTIRLFNIACLFNQNFPEFDQVRFKKRTSNTPEQLLISQSTSCTKDHRSIVEKINEMKQLQQAQKKLRARERQKRKRAKETDTARKLRVEKVKLATADRIATESNEIRQTRLGKKKKGCCRFNCY